MSNCRDVFFLEQPTCLGFKNVRKGLTEQQTDSGIKIALQLLQSQQLCWGLLFKFPLSSLVGLPRTSLQTKST